MKFVILFCFNFIGIYSKDYLITAPAHPPRKTIKVYRIIRPIHASVYRHGIEIQFIKDPTTASAVHEPNTATITPEPISPVAFEISPSLAHPEQSDPITNKQTIPKAVTESSMVTHVNTSATSDFIDALKRHLKTASVTRTILHPVTKEKKGERRTAARNNIDKTDESTTKRLAYKEDLEKLLAEVAAKQKCTENHDNVTPPQSMVFAASVKPIKPPLKLNNIYDVLDLLKAVSHKEKIQRVMDGYIQAAQQLSEKFPDQVIEVQVEFNSPVKKEQEIPRFNNYRRSFSSIKKPLRLQKQSEDVMTQTHVTAQTRKDITTQTTKGTSTFTTTTTTTIAPQPLRNPEKVPIYLDDLKAALEVFSKKQAENSNCNHKTTNQVKMHDTSSGLAKPHPHSLQDIMQLIGKGVKIQQNVPEPVGDDMDWLQIKLPSEVSA